MEFKVYLLVVTFVWMFTQSISTPPQKRSSDDKVNDLIKEMAWMKKSLNEMGKYSEEQIKAAKDAARVSSIV